MPAAASTTAPAAARCLDCGYVLDHLDARRCPECGRGFDPRDPATYTRKPPRVTWRLWLPGVGLAVGTGLLAWFVLLGGFGLGWGWAATLAVPLAAGGLVGYGCRVPASVGTTAGAVIGLAYVGLTLFGLVAGGIAGGFAGLLCGGMLLISILGPVLLAWAVGRVLRACLKRSRWDQAAHLPIVLGLIALPYVVAAIEGRLRPGAVASVTTTLDLAVPADAAFAAWRFYEDVPDDLPRPWLLSLSPSLRPSRVLGHARLVGDAQTCVYERGRLTKRLTAVDPAARRVEFVVTEQIDIEDQTLRLLGGSMTFASLPDGGCRATLVTTYRPLIRPRLLWRPAEVYAMRSVHRHVLAGIEREAGS